MHQGLLLHSLPVLTLSLLSNIDLRLRKKIGTENLFLTEVWVIYNRPVNSNSTKIHSDCRMTKKAWLYGNLNQNLIKVKTNVWPDNVQLLPVSECLLGLRWWGVAGEGWLPLNPVEQRLAAGAQRASGPWGQHGSINLYFLIEGEEFYGSNGSAVGAEAQGEGHVAEDVLRSDVDAFPRICYQFYVGYSWVVWDRGTQINNNTINTVAGVLSVVQHLKNNHLFNWFMNGCWISSTSLWVVCQCHKQVPWYHCGLNYTSNIAWISALFRDPPLSTTEHPLISRVWETGTLIIYFKTWLLDTKNLCHLLFVSCFHKPHNMLCTPTAHCFLKAMMTFVNAQHLR